MITLGDDKNIGCYLTLEKYVSFILCSMHKSRACPLCEITDREIIKWNKIWPCYGLRDEQKILNIFRWEMFLFGVNLKTILKDNEKPLQLKLLTFNSLLTFLLSKLQYKLQEQMDCTIKQ